MMHKSVIVLALLALVFATAHAQDGHPEEPQHKDEHHPQEEHHGQEGAPATPTTPNSAPALPGKLHFIEAEFAETEGNMIAALEVFEKYATAVLHDPTITQPKDKKAVDKAVVECAFGGNVDAVIKAHQAFLADLKQPNAQVEDALEKHLKPMLAEDITWMKAFTKRQDCLGKAEANKVVETVLKKTSVQLNPHAPTDKPKKEEKPKKENKDKKDKKDKKPKKADKKIHPEPQPGAKEDKPEKRKAADVLKKLVPGFVKESWTKASTQVSGKYAAMLKAYEERQAKAEHKKQVKAAEYPNFDSKVIVIAQRYPRYKLLFVEMKKACAKEDHCKGSRLQKIEAVLKEVETACSDINKAI